MAKLRRSINRWALCVTGFAVAAASGQPAFPAYFDDGNDKAAIMDLRAKEPDSLTDEERAILQAANRTGFVHIPACDMGSNAFLVRINGRDAILTSGHTVVDGDTGQIKNGCGPRDLGTAVYYPNLSYLDLRDGRPRPAPDDPIMRTVAVVPDTPLNLEVLNVGQPFYSKSDWIAFFLAEQISWETAPDGEPRGYFMYSPEDSLPRKLNGYIIGFDPEFDRSNDGRTSTWQKCSFSSYRTVYHTCDIAEGTSSSALVVLDEDELRFRGMQVAQYRSGVIALPKNWTDWNIGISGGRIEDQLPVGMAFDRE